MSTLVTGAGNGIGRLAALRAAAGGEAVAAVDTEADALRATTRRSPHSRGYSCDVTDADAVADVVARATDELGPIEKVVHAAGICRAGSALEQPVAELRQVMEVNYFGSVTVARAVVPDMARRRSGTMVLFGSLAGWVPSPALSAYAASKAAVSSFCEVLAQEHSGSGVRILCVCPGQVETRLAQRLREVDPGILGGQRGADAGSVLDSVDRALADPDGPLLLFPSRLDRQTWRARRYTPNLLNKAITRRVRPR